MYLHLGENTCVTTKEILGIFDLDTTTISKHTRDFLAVSQKQNCVINVNNELPNSFIITTNKGENQKVYLSQISASTLLKRSKGDF